MIKIYTDGSCIGNPGKGGWAAIILDDGKKMKNKQLKILLSAPRGFCAGVERAIEIVEKSIKKYGAPVYVRHEIVHNKYVVDDLKNKGAIFVEELEEIEDRTRPVIFSAHGVPKKIPEDAKNYNMTYVDGTSK